MDRRQFLNTSIGAALATQLGAQGPAPAPRAVATTKQKIDAYSRHLQWLRSADEVADAVVEMGFDGLDITVRPYPGHVDPTKVATDLPPFVSAIRKRGLQVVTMTCPITDADSPDAEAMLATAHSLGLTHYWWGTFRYEANKPIMEQLDALKPRVEKLAKLNEKYQMKAMYHTYSGNATVGAAIWDFLYVLKNFDPRYVSFHYDIGHMTNAGGNGTWALNLRAAAPYIGGISLKDSLMEPTFTVSGGGPFTGPPAPIGARGGGGGAPGGGRGAAGAPGAAPGGGRGAGAPGAAPGGGRAGAPGGQNTAAAGGRGGRGAGGPGGNAAAPGWRVRQVPLGTGMDNLPALAQILKEINFSGPVEVQAEYPNGGADNAQDKLSLPRAIVLGNMKRDLLAARKAFSDAGL
jgi:sugar phosphate isomerase/epimerase